MTARSRQAIVHAHPTDPTRFMVDNQSGSVWHLGDGPYGLADEIDSDFEATSDPADQPYQWRVKNAPYKLLFSPGNDTLDTADILRWEHLASELGCNVNV